MVTVARSVRNVPTWWHGHDHRCRQAGGPFRPGAAPVRPAAHAQGLGAASPGHRLAAVAARGRPGRLRRGPRLRAAPRPPGGVAGGRVRRPGRASGVHPAGPVGRGRARADHRLGRARPPVRRGGRGALPLLRDDRGHHPLPGLAAVRAGPRLCGRPPHPARDAGPDPGVQPPGGRAGPPEVGPDPRRLRGRGQRRLPGQLAAQRASGGGDQPAGQPAGGLARTDPLTGVPNRRVWEEELPRELDRARRMGTGLCLAMIDLDDFKSYNDRFGHQAGDQVLKEAAGAWRAEVRSTDLLARYGGEEFVLLLPACALDDAVRIVERLRTVTPPWSPARSGWPAGTSRRPGPSWSPGPTRPCTRPRPAAATATSSPPDPATPDPATPEPHAGPTRRDPTPEPTHRCMGPQLGG